MEVTMPARWTAKDERQYEHIKESERDMGRPMKRAKSIAAAQVGYAHPAYFLRWAVRPSEARRLFTVAAASTAVALRVGCRGSDQLE